jgi:hypothetical protein
MTDPAIEREIVELLGKLPGGLQHRLLDFARELACAYPSGQGPAPVPLGGTLTQSDAEAMRKAASGTRVDLLDW